ncbi:MAG: hypothetical protein R3290_11230 [Acidimicrobiia bacterium]|nr:hypothetical protein [Acidimicrobiia bacterium]
MKRLFAVVLALAMLAAACGDDDAATDDPEAQAAIQGLREAIAESSASDPSATFQVSDTEALCMAEGLFEEFGASRIIEAQDQEFEEFMAAATPEERRQTVDLMFECVDVRTAVVSQLGAEASGVSDDSMNCLIDGLIDSDAFRDGLASQLAGDGAALGDEAIAELAIPLVFECFSQEELTNLGG